MKTSGTETCSLLASVGHQRKGTSSQEAPKKATLQKGAGELKLDPSERQTPDTLVPSQPSSGGITGARFLIFLKSYLMLTACLGLLPQASVGHRAFALMGSRCEWEAWRDSLVLRWLGYWNVSGGERGCNLENNEFPRVGGCKGGG